MAQQLKEKFDKVCAQGQHIQKRLKYHQNQLTNLFSKLDVDLEHLETSIDKLNNLYTDVDVCINQNYAELKFSFFPSNMDVSYSVKYAGGTSPTDLILCHNRKCELKEIKSSLKKKIISKELQRRSCVEEKDCVIAVDMKRMVVRGVVMGVGTGQGAVVTILDIDTDDYRMATLDNIYVLDEESVSLYALCVRCTLDGDLTDLSKYWTSDLSNYFVSALKFGELIIETNRNVDESTVPPRFKVTVEVFVDDTKVLNVNQWLCEQLLPVVKTEAQNCLDLNKVIRGLDSKLLYPHLHSVTTCLAESSSNLSDSCVNSSQIISSPESSARSSTSEESEEFSVDIQIDKYSTPQYNTRQSASPISEGAPPPGQKEIDVFFTNAHVMGSPSGDSLQGRGSKCECGVDCAALLGGNCPPDLLTPSPKLPRITTVIPSLARIPNDTGGISESELPDAVDEPSETTPVADASGETTCIQPAEQLEHDSKGETFYYTMKNKSKTCLLPTPNSSNSVSGNKSETEIRGMDSFYNQSNGRLPGDLKHKSDNSLSSGGQSRRGPPRSHLYTAPLIPPYLEEGYAAGDTQYGGAPGGGGYGAAPGAGYGEKPLLPMPGAHGPNSRGEGISLKPHHYCQAEHLDKVQSVKLPGSVLLVQPGQERKAMVSSAENPGKFYVIICEDSAAHMDELEQALCEHYSRVDNLVSLVTIEEARYHLGDFVAAKWKSDGGWYRARVLDWTAGIQNSLRVLYVDHGNVDLVPLDYIQPLDPAFAHYATMAQPCHLAHLIPSGSNTCWSQEAVDMFCRFCNQNPHEIFALKFQPSSSNDSSSSWSVVLRNAQDECINDLLVKAGLATPTKLNGHGNTTPSPPLAANKPLPSLPSPTVNKDDKWFTKEKLQNILAQYSTSLESIESLAMGLNFNKNIMKVDNTDIQKSNLFVSQGAESSYHKDVPEFKRNLESNEKVPVSTDTIHCTRSFAPAKAQTTFPANANIKVPETIPVLVPTSCDSVSSSTVRLDLVSSVVSPDSQPLADYCQFDSSNIPIPGVDSETFRKTEGSSQVTRNEATSLSEDLIDFNSPYSVKCSASRVFSRSHLEDFKNLCRTSEELEVQVSENSTVLKIPDDLDCPGSKNSNASRLLEDSEGRVSRESYYSRKLEDPEGRISRNSNVSRTLENESRLNKNNSNNLQMVGELLHKFGREIDSTSQVLGEAIKKQLKTVTSLANNEARLKQIENLIHDSCTVVKVDTILDPLNNDKIDKNEQNFPANTNDYGTASTGNDAHFQGDSEKIKINQVLNNLDPCHSNKFQHTNTLLSSERIVNRLKSPAEERTHKVINELRTNAFQSITSTPPMKSQSNEDRHEINVSKTKSTSHDYKQSEDGKLSGIAENLNENLLVSSSDSSVRRGQVPQFKKSRSRKLVKADFSTIISTMTTDETEKQRRIEDYVESSMQHVTKANTAAVETDKERIRVNTVLIGISKETHRVNTPQSGNDRHRYNTATVGVDKERLRDNIELVGDGNERHRDNIAQDGFGNERKKINTAAALDDVGYERKRDKTTLVGISNETHKVNNAQVEDGNDRHKDNTAFIGLDKEKLKDNTELVGVCNETHRDNTSQDGFGNERNQIETALHGVGEKKRDNTTLVGVGNSTHKIYNMQVEFGNDRHEVNTTLVEVDKERLRDNTAQDQADKQMNNEPREMNKSYSAESNLHPADFETYNSNAKTSLNCNVPENYPFKQAGNVDGHSKSSGSRRENESYDVKMYEKVNNVNDNLGESDLNNVKTEAGASKGKGDALNTSTDSKDEGNVFFATLPDSKAENHNIASSSSSDVLPRGHTQEMAVKKKRRPRKSRQLDAAPPGVSLRSLAKKSNIFECLDTLSHSADVSSEETSSSAPQHHTARHRSNPNQSENINPNSHQNDSARSTILARDKGLNKNVNPRDRSTRRKSVDSNGPKTQADLNEPKTRFDPTEVNASKCHSVGFKDQSERDTSARANQNREGVVKTQKWYWLTLRQELLLKDKVSRTIKVKVTRVSGVAEFFCQTIDIFPEYEQGFKALFVASNTPAVSGSWLPASCIRPARLVMARDPKSNLWYRSEVLQRDAAQQVCKVFFVDFGTETYVRETDVREIQPDYTTVPYQAIRCELHNVVVSREPEFTGSEDCVNCYRVWSSLVQAGQIYEVKIEQILESKKSVAISMETDGFDMGQMLALQCYTPFVAIKSPALQGDWGDFVYTN